MNVRCDFESADWDLLALGSLEQSESSRLRAHLEQGCAACARLYANSSFAATAIGAGVAQMVPSPAVEARLREMVSPQVRKQSFPWMAIAAGLAIAGWGGTVWLWMHEAVLPKIEVNYAVASAPQIVPPNVVKVPVERVVTVQDDFELNRLREREAQLVKVRSDLEGETASLRAKLAQAESKYAQLAEVKAKPPETIVQTDRRLVTEVAELSSQLRMLEKQLDEYRAALRALDGVNVRQVELAVVDAAGGKSSARAIYSAQGGMLVLAHDLPALPQEKCYQVWIIRKGSPSIVSGGLMRVDAQGRGFLSAPPTAALRDATGFAITDEPQGGSVTARGRKLLFGAL